MATDRNDTTKPRLTPNLVDLQRDFERRRDRIIRAANHVQTEAIRNRDPDVYLKITKQKTRLLEHAARLYAERVF